jgi:hypothetical protein
MYYAQIRSLLRERPELRPYLKRCKHCRVFFFTDPRNASRDDLRCGFGCREAHRRQSSARRSAAFYREHPEKKRHQNRKRYLRVASEVHGPDGGDVPERSPSPIVHHVQVLVSLIERRRVGIDEVVALLAKKERQHRMVGARPWRYGGRRIRDRGS